MGREFLENARAAADDEGRLPLGSIPEWEVFPFEPSSLRARPLTEYAVPEPDRSATPESCPSCRGLADEDRVLWTDEHFAFVRATRTSIVFTGQVVAREHLALEELDGDGYAALGQALGAAYNAVKSLPEVGQVHLNKWENGKGHLSFAVHARPVGVLQLRGSNLPIWADMLPPVPEDEFAARAEMVRQALA
jgi:hypothetical protein